MIKPIKIKDVEIKNNIFLAPMAGYTDVGFRTLCKSFGAGLTCTEMVSAKALSMGKETGSIEIGKYADLIVCDKELNIKAVFVNGKRI